MLLYDRGFYQGQMGGSARSAAVVVPIILKLLPIRSICDVGCGVGTWLSVFEECGISDFLGLDGDYVQQDLLRIPSAHFRPTDLGKQFRVDRKFDLAISLEVAEHLPASRAASFVEDLTRLAPVIVFSAALPHQGGVGHVNEQWPSWWAEIFARHDFRACDAIRPIIWDNADVKAWYRQNIVVFVKKDAIGVYKPLVEARPGQLDLVHPEFYSQMVDGEDTKELLRHLWWAINKYRKKWRRRRDDFGKSTAHLVN